ncbi:hypothetical protein EU537_11885 [Candidatus Thorarchaeota archaeon]|nr:MAG: hypothetical protein EU537_11885 [Candidatus Thorarchaeota archaeon]
MSGRLQQLIGALLVFVSLAMSYVVYTSTIGVSDDFGLLLTSGLVAWAILALPELAIGLWLISRGSRQAKLSDISGDLIPLIQDEGRMSVSAAARELGTTEDVVSDAAERLARKRLPVVYLNRSTNEIVSPRSVELRDSLLHLLFAQRRMTFKQLQEVTDAREEEIIETLRDLSREGKFRGVIDENSGVVYTQEAVEELPNAVTSCPNCGGKLEEPVLPGEEEKCPYCGHLITNRLGL